MKKLLLLIALLFLSPLSISLDSDSSEYLYSFSEQNGFESSIIHASPKITEEGNIASNHNKTTSVNIVRVNYHVEDKLEETSEKSKNSDQEFIFNKISVEEEENQQSEEVSPKVEINSDQGVKNNIKNEVLHISLPQDYKLFIEETLEDIPQNHYSSLKNIKADYTDSGRRGLASYRTIYLDLNLIETSEEFKRVFIHEIGHVVDLGLLRSENQYIDSGFRDGSNVIYETDPSLDFYRLCWDNEVSLNYNCIEDDFVSQYGMTDAFEDFAESYLLFVENNGSFKQMAYQSDILMQKYLFFANVVFQGDYEETPAISFPQGERVWDLTLVY